MYLLIFDKSKKPQNNCSVTGAENIKKSILKWYKLKNFKTDDKPGT